jgi:hypothetical protein
MSSMNKRRIIRRLVEAYREANKTYYSWIGSDMDLSWSDANVVRNMVAHKAIRRHQKRLNACERILAYALSR